MKRLLIIICLIFSVSTTSAQAAKPRLVVNIVVAGIGADELSRYSHNLTDGGIAMLSADGATFTEARYDYQHTSAIAGAATITTGTNPSMHGVISEGWIDYTTNLRIDMIEDNLVHGIGCDAGQSRFSNQHIVVPTIGDELKEKNPTAKVATLAMNPYSAIALGGKSDTFWFNYATGAWNSSSAYIKELPKWLKEYNESGVTSGFKRAKWELALNMDKYQTRRYSNTSFRVSREFERVSIPNKAIVSRDFSSLAYTPVAIDITFDAAKQVFIGYDMGKDDTTDILNIGIDALDNIGRVYGTESVEREDAIYRFDASLADFVRFVQAQYPANEILWIVTSSNGMGNSNRNESRKFNPSQFKVIINGFLSTQLGRGNWITDCIDRQVYLNRVNIYSAGLNLADVQNRVAAFAMQFRGISHVLSATAMQNGYFGESYGRKIQNSFYPRRSGDLVLNLMPGWIETKTDEVASSGTMYDYDTHVPLIISGFGIEHQTITDDVNMCSIAPTIGRIIGIGRPTASEAPTLGQLFKE